jgi:hypothetical protein
MHEGRIRRFRIFVASGVEFVNLCIFIASSATQHRRLLNIVRYSTSSVTQHHQPCPQAKLGDQLRKSKTPTTRPHQFTNLRIFPGLFTDYFCVF